MGKSPRTSQGRSIARRMESSGGRRKQKGDGLVPGSKHAGLFSDDAIASFDELLNSDDVAFRTAPGPPVRRTPPPEPDSAAAASTRDEAEGPRDEAEVDVNRVVSTDVDVNRVVSTEVEVGGLGDGRGARGAVRPRGRGAGGADQARG